MMLRPYHIIFHGNLEWHVVGDDQPKGFYCGRTMVATTAERAAARAVKSIRDNLDAQTGWLTSGTAKLTIEVDRAFPVSWRRVFERQNLGHTFYDQE